MHSERTLNYFHVERVLALPQMMTVTESPLYWQWTLDNSGTMIRNLSSNDFDKSDGISMTVDAVTACIAVDSQSSLNDFSKCTDLKNVVCQFDNLLIGATFKVVSYLNRPEWPS